jgi:hypothetical protein
MAIKTKCYHGVSMVFPWIPFADVITMVDVQLLGGFTAANAGEVVSF